MSLPPILVNLAHLSLLCVQNDCTLYLTDISVQPAVPSEPAVIDAFAKIWDTTELLVSFDGANITLPHPDRQSNSAWPHVDQSPKRKGLQCVQGLLNLAPNGPRDGGLIVLKGSSLLNEAFFKAHPAAGERTCKEHSHPIHYPLEIGSWLRHHC